jgi:hypothetical protein
LPREAPTAQPIVYSFLSPFAEQDAYPKERVRHFFASINCLVVYGKAGQFLSSLGGSASRLHTDFFSSLFALAVQGSRANAVPTGSCPASV